MLAEDDVTMVSLLQMLLTMEGYQVVALGGAEDVLSAMRRQPPDLLILDVYRPGQSGLEVVRDIRAADDLKHIFVVMTSGMDHRNECLSSGADDFLLKPFMPDDFLSTVKRHMKPSVS